MTILRVRLGFPPYEASAQPWALHDEAGALLRTGVDLPDRWPAAATAEAVIAAPQVRVAVLALPPLPTSRVRAAALFAVEDQLAGPPESQQVAVSRQTADGAVTVVIVDRQLLQSVLDLPAKLPGLRQWSRVLAEPQLAGVSDDWLWCADENAGGSSFMRFANGSAMAMSPPPAAGALPDELLRLLAHHRPAPMAIDVHASVPATHLAAWSQAAGIRFVAGAPWRWQASSPPSFAAAIDLLQGDFAPAAPPRPDGDRRLWRLPLAIAALALFLHLAATVGEWAWLRLDAMRDNQSWRTLASNAGLAVSDADDARTALDRRFGELRHANGLAAPGDALPLLARAAPSLARLPRGALKGATFSAGAWTIELGAVDPEHQREFDAGMKAAGLPALIARTPTGIRARFGRQAP